MSLLAETKRRVMPATNFAQVFDNFSLYKLWYELQIPEAINIERNLLNHRKLGMRYSKDLKDNTIHCIRTGKDKSN